MTEYRKAALAKKIMKTEDEILLLNIERMMASAGKDPWDEYSDDLKKSIEAGFADIEAGRVTAHTEVIAEIKKRYGL